jgi:D-3-phosphoglycerate dehydrogenase
MGQGGPGKLKILVIYDTYMPEESFRRAFSDVLKTNDVRFARLSELDRKDPETESERSIREYNGNPDELAGLMKDDDILVVHAAPVTDKVLKASPNLKAVFCVRGGPVNIDVESASRLGILVSGAPGRNAEAVADFTMALMLVLARKVLKGAEFVKGNRMFTKEEWEGFFGHELKDMVLGLVGYGNVGSRVAKRALSFGMTVLVYDPFVEKAMIEGPGVAVTDFESLISSSDFVSLHAREAPENVDMFGRKQFEKMKKTAYFINTARGSLVDEDALYEALSTGKIAGAALDVMKVEPIDPASRLVKLPNIVVTPHIAGASHEVRYRGAEIVAKNVEGFILGSPIGGMMNPEVLTKKRGI